MTQDMSIKCPKCGESLPLDETIAAPVISRIRLEAEASVKRAEDEAAARVSQAAGLEASLAAKELELIQKESTIENKVNQALATERKKLVAAERENILKELSPEIEAERTRSNELQEKLETSRRAELQLRQEKASVDEKAKNLELEVARKVDDQLNDIREQARNEVEQEAQTKIKRANDALSALQEQVAVKGSRANELELALAEKQRELAEKELSVQGLVIQAVADERKKVVAEVRENLRKELSPEIEAERARSKELQEKLDVAQSAELALRQEKQAIDERAKNLELEVARKVDEQRKTIQEQASKDADDTFRLKIAEKEKTIADMQLKLEEAQRKATLGSQQLQGEVLERDFESSLRQVFPQDTIEPVKTGARGGDILQRVLGQMARPVATILWETKRAQAWGGDWASKAKKDAAESKAEVALVVSEVLPKGVQGFGVYEGVWCVLPSYAVMLGLAIRQGVISTAEARQGAFGRETKKDRLYDYMIGPEFRATIEGIALPFREIYDELAAEKRSTISRWKRQEKRLERVLENIAGFQGELQAIAGSEILELPGFETGTGDSALLE